MSVTWNPKIFGWCGSTGPTQSKYDWNNPKNWREAQIFQGQKRWAPIQAAIISPGALDIVWIGSEPAEYGWPSLTAQSPLLFGGFSGSAAGGVWLNSQSALAASAGHTYNSHLTNFRVGLTANSEQDSYYDSMYPFPYVGGGLTGEILEWALAENGLSFGSVNLSDTRTQSLKLKARSTTVRALSIGNGPDSPYKMEFSYVKNLQKLNGDLGPTPGASGTSAATVISCFGLFSHNGNLVVSGGHWNELQQNSRTNNADAKPTSTFENMVVRNLRVQPGVIFVDSSVTAGNIKVRYNDWTRNFAFTCRGNVDMPAVMKEAYLDGVGDSTAEIGDSEIYLQGQDASLDGSTFIPCHIGSPYTRNATKIGSLVLDTRALEDGSSTVGQWKLLFDGSAKINRINSNNGIICASPSINSDLANVEIGTVYMDVGSLFDFSANSAFDRWTLGSETANNGGIVFLDEKSIVRGSGGIRLWNTKMVLGKTDTRLSASNTISSKPVSKATVADAPTAIL